MTKTLADEVRELQDRLSSILNEDPAGWPNFQVEDARFDALRSAQKHISQALETHNHHQSRDFGEEYLNHIDEAMEILYEILKQHNRL